MLPTHVNVGAFEPRTRAMGPGVRACLWVRGCSINCPGCATPEFIPANPATQVSIEMLIANIERARDEHRIEGVSFSGGEPFEQAFALAEIARATRGFGLSTLSWSGYTRRHLESGAAPPGSQELMSALDVLIDGPFVRSKLARLPLRGSSNQQVHLLTDRYGPDDFRHAVVEARLRSGRVIVTGVMDVAGIDAVANALSVADLDHTD